MKGLDVPSWLERTVALIKQRTDRPIVVRGHPGDRHHRVYIDKNKFMFLFGLIDDIAGYMDG